MKIKVFVSMVFTSVLMITSCTKSNDNNIKSNIPVLKAGTYNVTGTITLNVSITLNPADGRNYTVPMKNIVVNTLGDELIFNANDGTGGTANPIIVLTISSPNNVIKTGIFSIPTTSVNVSYSVFSFENGSLTKYTADNTIAGSSATINLTTFTATSIKGTFTALVIPPSTGPYANLTSGVINCTIGSL
jgi:hypothetical protein